MIVKGTGHIQQRFRVQWGKVLLYSKFYQKSQSGLTKTLRSRDLSVKDLRLFSQSIGRKGPILAFHSNPGPLDPLNPSFGSTLLEMIHMDKACIKDVSITAIKFQITDGFFNPIDIFRHIDLNGIHSRLHNHNLKSVLKGSQLFEFFS